MDICLYNEKLEHYVSHSKNNMQILEIEKCCGYSEFTFMYKNATLRELYNSVYYQFQVSQNLYNLRLYIKDELGNEIQVPNNETILKDFINGNRPMLKPLYPVPAHVVYKFYLDDTQSHGRSMH
jgi:hypothetical protein